MRNSNDRRDEALMSKVLISVVGISSRLKRKENEKMKKLFVLWVQMLDSLRSRILQLLKDDSGEQTISWFGVMVLSDGHKVMPMSGLTTFIDRRN